MSLTLNMRNRDEIVRDADAYEFHGNQDGQLRLVVELLLDILEHLVNTEAIREYEEALKKPHPLEIKVQGTSDKTDG